MSKEIYTCDVCRYTFEAEAGCVRCPDCGKKRVRPADEQESKEYPERQKHGYMELNNHGNRPRFTAVVCFYQ